MHRINSWLLALACMASFVVVPTSAQVSDASLGGRVVDAGGEGVAEARVFARREGTGVRRSVRADEQGFYLFPPLPPGDWDVEASAEGFTIAVIGDVRLAMAQSRRLDLELEASDAQEMVSFVDYEPLVRTSPAVDESLDRWELRDLPLRRRSLADLPTLAGLPGTALGSPSGDTTTSPTLRLDGGLLVSALGPPISALREGELTVASYGAEFSGATGVVSLVTRTGGAAAKGSTFVFHREDDDAGAFSDLPESTFGVTLGGPLGRQSSKRGTHVFGSGEAQLGEVGDRRGFLVRASRHDRRNLLRLRHIRSDPEALGRADSLLVGWQTRLASSAYHDSLAQVERLESDLSLGRLFDDRVQLRSDVYWNPSAGAGLHDLAFGVENTVETLEATGAVAGGRDAESWSLYARDRWQVSERLQLRVGLRSEFVDDAERREDRLAPRAGLVWRLSEGGAHLLRGGVGRFHDTAAGLESEQLNLGWSWQMGPVVGVTLDAVSVDSDDEAFDYEALAFTVRSRFGGVFQVRASFSWTEPSMDPSGETLDRAVVTGLYQAPADVLVAAIYRCQSTRAGHAEAVPEGFDLRVAKGVSVGGDVTLELLAEVFDVFEEQAGEEGRAATGRVGQVGVRLSF